MKKLSAPGQLSSPGKTGRPRSQDDSNENLWSSLLDSVATGKRLPEKNIILLGGSPGLQKDFLDTLASERSIRPQERYRKQQPPLANAFALGYTYQDVLDADQEDILARISIYTLPSSSPAFGPLLKPLLTPYTIPETLLVLLLDWKEPWEWVRQLRDWIELVRTLVPTLGDDSRKAMDEVMQDWEQKRRVGSPDTGGSPTGNESNVVIPLGPGEWDEPLGLPICVACHNSDRMDVLEREHGWREEDFDYVLQFLRTILLKHGGSLIHTSNSAPNNLPLLVQSSLGIHSPLKRQVLKHNVIDRDRILIPPNWDSWGKIRVLREGFDVERTSDGWSLAIQPQPKAEADPKTTNPDEESKAWTEEARATNESSSVLNYEATVKRPKGLRATSGSDKNGHLETETPGVQEFLAEQSEIMERLKIAEDKQRGNDAKGSAGPVVSGEGSSAGGPLDEGNRVKEHIGPVQFNMGGIQVDAEDMLSRLRDRDREREDTPGRETPPAPAHGDIRAQNEALANFFAGLIKKGGTE